MIVLDTNQLDGSTINGSSFKLLKALADASHNKLCMPSLVLDEHLAHYAQKIREIGQKYESANRDFSKILPSTLRRMTIDIDLGEHVAYIIESYEAMLRKTFDVFEVDPASALEGGEFRRS